MSSEENLPTIKVLITGSSGVGKSALLLRYVDGFYDPESSTATIGVDFKVKKLSVHGKPYKVTFLDTAGQERFRTLSTSYYRNAHGVIIVYDISSRDSFLETSRWFEEAENHALPNAIKYLVCLRDIAYIS
jgi:Ras-related protein Rab-18